MKINRLVISNPPEYQKETFFLRQSDDLWVDKNFMSEHIPTIMISSEKNINKINRWRFYPLPFALIKRKYFTNSYVYEHRLTLMQRAVLNTRADSLAAAINAYELFRKASEKFRK